MDRSFYKRHIDTSLTELGFYEQNGFDMITTSTDVLDDDLHDIGKQANRLWRRAGVVRKDRHDLLAELEAEITGARHDGHGITSVVGVDISHTLWRWADERELSGRALRLEMVIPAALLGIAAGLLVVLFSTYLAFINRPSIDPGPLTLPMYASAGLLAYLCALLCVWIVLRPDPHASATVRCLALLLPVGTVVSTGAGIAIAWSRNFSTSSTVFSAVIMVVIIGLVATVGIARRHAVRGANADCGD